MTYKARGSTKPTELVISEKNLGYVDAGQSKMFEREPLPVPPLPPSNLSNCGIIDLGYHVEVIFSGYKELNLLLIWLFDRLISLRLVSTLTLPSNCPSCSAPFHSTRTLPSTLQLRRILPLAGTWTRRHLNEMAHQTILIYVSTIWNCIYWQRWLLCLPEWQ